MGTQPSYALRHSRPPERTTLHINEETFLLDETIFANVLTFSEAYPPYVPSQFISDSNTNAGCSISPWTSESSQWMDSLTLELSPVQYQNLTSEKSND